MKDENREEELKKEVDKYFEDLNNFIEQWKKTKKCNCNNPECKHYRSKFNKSEFRKRTDDLFNKYLYYNMLGFCKIWKEKK